MTTIVYDHKNGLIAIDSRCTVGGNIISDEYDKTIMKKNGDMWFITGEVTTCERLSKLEGGDKIPEGVIVGSYLLRGGIFHVTGSYKDYLTLMPLKNNDTAGSGCEFALAALDFGKTAKEAVEYAMTRDCYTGGKVRVFDLKGNELNV